MLDLRLILGVERVRVTSLSSQKLYDWTKIWILSNQNKVVNDLGLQYLIINKITNI